MSGEKRKLKVSMNELAGVLDEISWRLVTIAARYQDKELLDIFEKLQKFVDKAVFGEGLR